MTTSQAISSAYSKLPISPINSAYLDAELLLAFALGKPREYILAHLDLELSQSQILNFNKLIAQRAKNIPLAYLTKEKEFYGRHFYIDKRVLVPRPETEKVVDEVRCHCEESRAARGDEARPSRPAILRDGTGLAMTIVDVGTGSGCIIITLAKELENLKLAPSNDSGSKISNLKLFATDISSDTLAVARKNAKIHGVDKKIKFLCGNLLQPILNNKTFAIRHSSFVICANLPYLTPRQIKQSPTIKHEPRLALSAGSDGLKYYRELAAQLRQFNIKYPNIPVSLFCEIDPKQSKAIKKIFSSVIPANAGIQKKNNQIKIKKDLAGRNRIAVVKL